MRSCRSAPVTATCTEVGNTSFDDCDALTWSFGWTGDPRMPRGERGEHLVHVHVRRGAASRSGRRRPGTGRGAARRSAGRRPSAIASAIVAVEDAELAVDDGGRPLDAGERHDLRRLEPGARDREVLDRALRLGAVEAPYAGTRTSPIVSCSMRYSAASMVVGRGHVVVVLPSARRSVAGVSVRRWCGDDGGRSRERSSAARFRVGRPRCGGRPGRWRGRSSRRPRPAYRWRPPRR